MADKDLINWAREEAARLRKGPPSPTTGGLAATGKARQFFADHAGGSVFEANSKQAVSKYNTPTAMDRVSTELEEWATFQESAAAATKPFEVRFRVEVQRK
jgi:hypothetical protein